MIVREAKESDIDPVLGLIHEFQRESIDEFNLFCDDTEAKEFMKKMVDNGLILETDGPIKIVVGVIAGIITNYHISKEPLFQEVIWFVTKKYRKYGVKLYRELERRCKLAGIKHIIMVHMANSMPEKVGTFYERLGYKKLETQYIKNL